MAKGERGEGEEEGERKRERENSSNISSDLAVGFFYLREENTRGQGALCPQRETGKHQQPGANKANSQREPQDSKYLRREAPWEGKQPGQRAGGMGGQGGVAWE